MCKEVKIPSSCVTVNETLQEILNGYRDQNEVAVSFSHSYYSYYRLEPREFHDRFL